VKEEQTNENQMLFMIALAATAMVFSIQTALGVCGDRETTLSTTYSGSTCDTTFTKTVNWRIYWMDGYTRDVGPRKSGQHPDEMVLPNTSPGRLRAQMMPGSLSTATATA
jgi:hypothetical protein